MSTQVLRSSRQPKSYSNSRQYWREQESGCSQQKSQVTLSTCINSLPPRNICEIWCYDKRLPDPASPSTPDHETCLSTFFYHLQEIVMTTCPALQELCGSGKYFSLSSSELFKLTFKPHSGTISPISNPDRVLKWCLLERPALISYKSQTHSAWYHFSQKRSLQRRRCWLKCSQEISGNLL